MAKKPTPAGTSITYADAGVNIDRAARTKQRIKYLAHKTFTRGVLSEIGGFGGLFAVDKEKYTDPVLVSSVDGVGTKLKIAFEMGLHSTIGADLVNHCVNDIAVQGAAPLFFMDYLATGTLDPTVAEQVVEGIADACKHNNCALIGGETAEMPGFYPDGEYDLAGFIVGVVERDRIITGKDVQIGDVVLGLAFQRLAHQWIFPGAEVVVRSRPLLSGRLRQRDQEQSGQRTDANPQKLLAGAQETSRCAMRFGAGSHHRRWNHGKSAARPATRNVGLHRPWLMAGSARVRASAAVGKCSSG